MAPELWSGQPATVKTDLYALGVMAFELLGGSRPFPGPDEASYRRQHQLEAPPPLPANVLPTVGRLVLRLLAKNPTERPQDARAVLEGLDAASRRMAPVQNQLAQAAQSAQVRRSAEEVGSARLAAQQRTAETEREQALADLKQILEDAADLARETLPDLKFTGNYLQWHLMVDDAFVGVVPWLKVPNVPGLAFKDPLVVVGVVYSNPPTSYPRANITCEHELPWSPGGGAPEPRLWLSEQEAVVAYRVGPTGREAGTVAVLRFPGCQFAMFGTPGHNGLLLHPLQPQGLELYGIYEVLNSSFDAGKRQWMTDARGAPRPANPGRPSGSRGSSRHFIITFHDQTFECIADDIVGHTAADLPPFPAN